MKFLTALAALFFGLSFTNADERIPVSPPPTVSEIDQLISSSDRLQGASKIELLTKAKAVANEALNANPTPEEQLDILRVKLKVLSRLEKNQIDGAADEKKVFLEELSHHSTPEISRLAKGELLNQRVRNFFKSGEQQEVIRDVKEFVLENPPSQDSLSVARMMSLRFIQSGRNDVVGEFSASLAEHFAKSSDPELQKAAKQFEGTANRATLVGKEMSISGVTLNGDKVDLGSLKGKVVLVDFWSTGCPSCHEDANRLKKLYALYHSAGFEVLGITLWNSRESTERFVSEKKIPWLVMRPTENQDDPNAIRYGIDAVPTGILVDRDGKVLSISAVGSDLTKLLEDQFSDSYVPLPK